MKKPTLIIGTFDGVHRGHRALFQYAKLKGADKIVVLAFDGHPAVGIKGKKTPSCLISWEEKRTLLLKEGVSKVVKMKPDYSLLSLSPKKFLDSVVRDYNPKSIVEGSDFRFGYKREGDINFIRNHALENNYDFYTFNAFYCWIKSGVELEVRARNIRWLLEMGRVEEAAQMLGRNWSMEGKVESGSRRGREIKIPTANMDVSDWEKIKGIFPRKGVYAGKALGPDNKIYKAAISVGNKPTFKNENYTVETHMIGYRGEVENYGWFQKIWFHKWIRDQYAFDSLNSLKAQITTDLHLIKEIIYD